jgi:hypothetical protein
MAGVPGLEPGPKVLETSMLAIDTIPLCGILDFWILDFGFVSIRNPKSDILNHSTYSLYAQYDNGSDCKTF